MGILNSFYSIHELDFLVKAYMYIHVVLNHCIMLHLYFVVFIVPSPFKDCHTAPSSCRLNELNSSYPLQI